MAILHFPPLLILFIFSDELVVAYVYCPCSQLFILRQDAAVPEVAPLPQILGHFTIIIDFVCRR